ncbi:putative ATPase [Sinorhizobium medicae]|uniref:AAA family ATPase n=1 Tax=Sinorhizobium medicae TaxID=110321 RepID=UPI000FDC47AB|nr:adenylate/guanylate cyclase domain-containing protein [Sinorhizobium medicae]MDX0524349.1 AAA family ATPase [Sinorhizobium medicae]MDX0635983.1 AAA family ATPase [Sinorhizobium medicae]MDX0695624.1 AAA family ATPase [Sinorhizobium medicae]MDX0745320.1 AAA family ATPase [Sinorhizobium medicae]RVH89307.1 adenylate/guanylate cyclase domain-containing protein [Sinorhizobium medicae]
MSDVTTWLAEIGLQHLAGKFADAQIDFDTLALLSEQDLRELGIPLGPRRKLLAAIAALGRSVRPQGSDPTPVERRQLTILIGDMVGSTEYASRLDPEDVSQLTQTFLSRCSALAKTHGGFVANYVGDALQVLFGFPAAEENDAERAIHLAFDIVAAVPQIETPDSSRLGVRIGVASGLVVVGDIEGAPAGISTVAFGHVPNLAQRLQAIAEPNGIFVDENTFRATASAFAYADIGEKTLKGFSDPVHVRRALKPIAREYRFAGELRSTPLVGRRSELQAVEALWDAVRADRHGRVALISGEPGIGKSRLLFEVGRSFPGVKALVAQCAPAFANSALYPFLRLFKQEVGITEDALLSSDRLRAALSSSTIPLSVSYPIFTRLLTVEPDYEPSRLASSQQEAAISQVFSGWLRQLSSAGPLMLFVEDEQWIDPSSGKLLQTLAHDVAQFPVLLLVTSREKQTKAGFDNAVTAHLALERFSREEAGEFVQNVIEGGHLSSSVVATLLSKAEGVPLYLEELARSALMLAPYTSGRSGAKAECDVDVPVSLQSALMSRLDKLGAVKTVAQTAAVIGREFDLKTLAHVVGLSSEMLRPQIERLVAVGLVAPQPFSNWPRYSFSHSLLQEAARGALLRDRRRELHALVAKAIEVVQPTMVVEHPEILAQHYDEATQFELAADYWLRAGRKLGATWAKVEAANMFAKGIECVRRMPPSKMRDSRELTLELERGDVLYAAYGYITRDGSDAYRNVMRLSEATGDSEAAIRALDGLFGTSFNSARFSDAEWASNQLKEIGRRDGNIKALVLGLQFGGMCAFARGRFPQAREVFLEALENREHADEVGSDFPSMSMLYLSWTLQILGDADAAMELFHAAEMETRRQTDYRLAACLGNGCILMSLRQDVATLQRLVDDLVPLAKRNGFQLWLNFASFFSGWAKVASRQDASGLAQMKHICDNMGQQEVDKTCYLGVLADSYLRMGRVDEATAVLDQALKLAARTGEHYYTSELLRLRGELLRQTQRLSDAKESFQEAISFARDQGAKAWEARAKQSLDLLSSELPRG